MKKIIALSILTILVYGFTYSSVCKLCNVNTAYKYENRSEMHSPTDVDEDEFSFHPLMFVRIPFK